MKRTGFSLLEVVIAMAIFMVAVIILSDVVNNAGDLALDVQFQDQANLKCQGKMSEVIVGAEKMASADSFTPYSDTEDGWQWRMESNEVQGVTGLFEVKVIVRYEKAGTKIESRLSQMVLDPNLRGSTMDRPTSTTTTGAAP